MTTCRNHQRRSNLSARPHDRFLGSHPAQDYTSRLEEAGIAVSQDGRGRALDKVFVERLWRSVKHKDIYIKQYDLVLELESALRSYVWFYDEERPHSSLDYQTPGEVYRAGIQGGLNRGKP
jgi:putative transposase